MAKQVGIISEKYLLEALERVSRNPSGYSVLYINISRLKPKNRHPEFVKIFAKMFDSVVGETKGELFVLSNGDFAILGKDITHDVVDSAVKKLRDGLSTDPILHSKDSSDFFSIYDFPDDFFAFHEYVSQMAETARLQNRERVEIAKRSLEPEEVDEVIKTLNDIDLAEIVKRQSVLRLKGAGKFEVVFQEFFVAVKDLSLQFDANIDLLSNRWLFFYLTQALDKKTMSSFFGASIKNWPQQISLNLNLSSVFSKEFVDFGRNFVKPEQKIVVEVQLTDVFNNFQSYFQAMDILHHGGHKLVLDAVSPATLRMINIEKIKPDMLKIFWEPLLEDDVNNEELQKVIECLGKENVILAKCDNEKAIRWGLQYGITAFQGPYIDNLEVALIRAKCPYVHECSVNDCLKRKRRVSGWFKNECKNQALLETLLG